MPTEPRTKPKQRRGPRLPVAKPGTLEWLTSPKEKLIKVSAMDCMRVARVARLLDVSPKRIYQYIEEGRIRTIRLGPRQIRIPKSSLEKFLNENEHELF